MLSPEEERQRGLTRDRLVGAALELIQEEGLEGLSMRALADRLEVKAASLYWHVRDRRELLELVADSILDQVRPAGGSAGWRSAVMSSAAVLRQRVAGQKDADRVLLEVPDALTRSDVYVEMGRQLQVAGLQPAEAADVALLVMVQVVTAQAPDAAPVIRAGSVAKIAIDSGSRGVVLRAGKDMEGLVRGIHDKTSTSPAIVRGETVIVRRLRGVGLGEIELNPRHPWVFQIQGPTWNTVLDLGGVDVREVKLDGGAARVECFLPRPRGVVPLIVSGGVVGVKLHRPSGVAVVADVSTGAVRLKLDELSVRAVVSDLQWESADGASAAPDRYQLRISGGAVQIALDTSAGEAAPMQPPRVAEPPPTVDQPTSAIDILLDGVEARVRSRQ